MGPNMARLLNYYWEHNRIVPNMGKLLGKEFRMRRGLTQGDPASPTTFNIVVETVVRAFLYVV